MDNLYKFTQKELLKSSLVIDGKIKLVRSLRPYEIDYVTPQLINQDNSIISLPVNIINSYAQDGALFGYGSNISVVREIEIKKILMYYECLNHPNNVCDCMTHAD